MFGIDMAVEKAKKGKKKIMRVLLPEEPFDDLDQIRADESKDLYQMLLEIMNKGFKFT